MNFPDSKSVWLIVVFWLLQGFGPVLFVLQHWGPNRNGKPGGDDPRVLTMPIQLVRSSDPLDGWNRLPARMTSAGLEAVEPSREAAAESAPTVATILEDMPFRIRMFGHVVEGDTVLYCLFDTESGRWLRLPEGGVDSESGIALSRSLEAGKVRILDLRRGVHHEILLAETSLSQMDPDR